MPALRRIVPKPTSAKKERGSSAIFVGSGVKVSMLGIFLAHPTEACAGGFQGMAPVSNACWWRQLASVTLTVPGETESSPAEVQLNRDISGDRAPMVLPVPDGPAFVGDPFSKSPLDTGAIPPKNPPHSLAVACPRPNLNEHPGTRAISHSIPRRTGSGKAWQACFSAC